MADIFVSYAREDRPRVEPFIELLEKQGWSVWWDREVVPGHSFGNVIDQEIERAGCVVVFWSHQSVDSNWVQVEANEGLERGRLIPILLDDVRVPLVFRRIESVPLTGWPDSHEVAQLERAFRAITDIVATGPAEFIIDTPRKRRLPAWVGLLTLAILATGGWWIQSRDEAGETNEIVEATKPTASIAVMPFTSMEVDIAHELSDVLGSAQGLFVVHPEHVAAHLESPGTINLDARYTIQGSARQSHLTVTLFDRERRETTWQHTVELDSTNLSAVIRSIVSGVLETFNRPSLQFDDVPHVAYLNYLQARTNLRADRGPEGIDAAERLFLASIEAAPRFAEAFAGLCETYATKYLESGDSAHFESAEKRCFRAATLSHDNPRVDYALGRLYRIAGQHDAALARLESALTKTPFSTDLLRELALVKSRQNLFEEAVALINAAIDLEPSYWKNHDALGALYFNTGRYQLAAAQYEKLASLGGDRTRVLNALGSSYYMMEEFDRAIVAWNESLSSQPTRYSLSNLGSAYFFNGDYETALEIYERAIDLESHDPRVWANAGEAAMHAGRDASSYYQQALKHATEQFHINPDNAEVLSLLASSHAALGNQADAEVFIERAISIAGDDVYVLYDIAVAYAHLGRDAEKDEMIQAMLALGYSQTLIKRDANLTRREL